MIIINSVSVKEKIMAVTLLIFVSANSVALPIVTDFTPQDKPAEKRSALESKKNVDVFKFFSHFNDYNSLIPESVKGSGFSNETPVQLIEIDINDTREDTVSELSQFVFEEFQLINHIIRRTSQDRFSSSSSVRSIVDVTDSHTPDSQYLNGKKALGLNLEPSGTLNSLLVKDKNLAAKKHSSIEQPSFLAMLKKILLDLLSPIPLFSFFVLIVIIFLSSRRRN